MKCRASGPAALLAALTLWLATCGTAAGQRPADLPLPATHVGEVFAFANDYVRVRYTLLEYPPAERRIAESRPIVVYVSVEPESGGTRTRLLELPPVGRKSWRTGVVPQGVHIEVVKLPPRPSPLGQPGTDPPRGSTVEDLWDGGRLVLATFEYLDYMAGTGRSPSVTVFLSDGMIEVAHGGVRRRMAVRAGDAFWFEAQTRITVVGDDAVGAAIVQIDPAR